MFISIISLNQTHSLSFVSSSFCLGKLFSRENRKEKFVLLRSDYSKGKGTEQALGGVESLIVITFQLVSFC